METALAEVSDLRLQVEVHVEGSRDEEHSTPAVVVDESVQSWWWV